MNEWIIGMGKLSTLSTNTMYDTKFATSQILFTASFAILLIILHPPHQPDVAMLSPEKKDKVLHRRT
jgi:hypothetical protein